MYIDFRSDFWLKSSLFRQIFQLRGAMGSGAAIEVGDEVTIKATKIAGVAKQSNGHACKVGNLWYHIDELEVAPKTSTPVRCGGPAYPVRCGGWNDAKAPGQEELEVWQKVTSEVQKDLASLGPPTSVISQVVAGMKYIFTFADGSKVTVVSVPWMNKVEVVAS